MQAMEKLHKNGFISDKKMEELQNQFKSGQVDMTLKKLEKNNDYTEHSTYGFGADQTIKNRRKRARKSRKLQKA